jgi:rhodanese-related sulfurtransferase
MASRRVLIVGGVAGGASAATRLRRLDETAEIILFDRGPYVAFANCGLPYYVGDVISDERNLLVASREQFRDRFNIDVRTEHEALRIDRESKTLRVRGAQAVGEEGIDKRIDVIATMIQMGGTVHDLSEAELCYAPQYGAAKDPVKLAGMMAGNALHGDMPLADWRGLGSTEALLLDVREPDEFAKAHIEGATNLPLSQLRKRVDEVPRNRQVWVYCAAGQRAYLAQRLLRQRGVDALNLSGGYTTWLTLRDAGGTPPFISEEKDRSARSSD